MPASPLQCQTIDFMDIFVGFMAPERVPLAQSVRFPDGAVFRA
jgi:hypothetical protein